PASVVLTVTDTDLGLKGDTATGATKPATLETAIRVNVPLFVERGYKIKVDTRTGEYLERAEPDPARRPGRHARGRAHPVGRRIQRPLDRGRGRSSAQLAGRPRLLHAPRQRRTAAVRALRDEGRTGRADAARRHQGPRARLHRALHEGRALP